MRFESNTKHQSTKKAGHYKDGREHDGCSHRVLEGPRGAEAASLQRTLLHLVVQERGRERERRER